MLPEIQRSLARNRGRARSHCAAVPATGTTERRSSIRRTPRYTRYAAPTYFETSLPRRPCSRLRATILEDGRSGSEQEGQRRQDEQANRHALRKAMAPKSASAGAPVSLVSIDSATAPASSGSSP